MNFDKIRDAELNRYLDEQDKDMINEELINDDIADRKYEEYKDEKFQENLKKQGK